MLRINQWQMKQEQKLICGHIAKQGTTAYAITFVVCGDDVSRTTQASVHTLQSMRQEPWRPSVLYQLWHGLWGNKRQQADINMEPQVANLEGSLPLGQTTGFIAPRRIQLDCGHTVNAGDMYHVTSVYTCGREGAWPLKILLSCFKFLQKPSAVQADRVQVSA